MDETEFARMISSLTTRQFEYFLRSLMDSGLLPQASDAPPKALADLSEGIANDEQAMSQLQCDRLRKSRQG